MTKDGLVKLAERCEAASGLNRELDQDIHEIVVIKSALSGTIYPYCKRYTASIDAAMTLIPEGWALDCLKEGEVSSWYVNLRPRYWVGEWQHSKAATPALALCAAALRARATTTGEAK